MYIKLYCKSAPKHASDDTSNDNLRDSPLLDLQTPDPYTHQKITPPTTPCVTAPPPPRNESTKSATWSKNPYS